MKKKLFSLMLCVFCVVGLNAEKVVATYTSSYFNKTYDIEASEIKNDKFSVYIGVTAENSSTKAMIEVESDKLEDFKQALLQTRDKFVEWSKVAKENNVKDMSKEMEVTFPSISVCWLGSKWFFSFGEKLKPKFLILDNGNFVVSFYKKVTASSNEYIDEKIYWVFSDSKEIDELISKLDVEKIKAKLQENVKAADLFK